MRPYEAVVIFDPDREDTAVNAVLDRATEQIRSAGGTVGNVDRWGRRTFAYELRHKREGYYVLVEFSAEPAFCAELDRLLGLADEVMRHKIVRLPDKAAGRKAKAAPVAAEAS